MLLKDRNLNIAILVSASWHLICMFSITPVLVPDHIKENSTTISFLGSILERIVAVEAKPFSLDRISLMQKIERMRDISSGEFTLTPPETALKPISLQPDKEKSIFLGDKHKTSVFKLHYKKREKRRIKFKDILITGEAKNRIVLYKPDLPKISILPSDFSFDYKVTIRFRISRHGFVEDPECIISSGSSEIDQMAIRYIRRWQFMPHDEGAEEAQQGVVRVNFSD